MKKSRVTGVRALQKQQGQLLKIQKALELLLVKVNESINALKVEELQLRSYAASEITKNIDENEPSTSAQAVALMSAHSLLNNASELATQTDYNLVNQQQINLESLLTPLKRNDNDFEEDDDDETETEDDGEEKFLLSLTSGNSML
ncbi:uncharacterized protein LOC119639583 [Glossina fuscipes]|uniref:Uncharacterized protein LOC119639583 n=1 Tax=Glossina fuscipes TaxID=7396 RepID=A0A9C5Z6J8_9MUSC|nr:uncharacterized protein LOC119639583 [Glossina fuscipes]KAI9580037.1 hypothetical protein GQX74_000825 [Glossina fuscipes]